MARRPPALVCPSPSQFQRFSFSAFQPFARPWFSVFGFFTLGGKKLCIAAKVERPEDRAIHEIRESAPFFRVFRGLIFS